MATTESDPIPATPAEVLAELAAGYPPVASDADGLTEGVLDDDEA